MLTERRQKILEALVNEYIAYAIPVGSRTLVDRYNLGVSPATVRNELVELEEEGYVASPHTSAGRIPTDSGYRSFVDSLMDKDEVVFDADAPVSSLGKASYFDDVVKDACVALSRLTSCLAVALAPGLDQVSLKQLNFVLFSPHRVLLVLVTLDGRVLNSNIELPEPMDAERLHSLEAMFNSIFAGKSGDEIRSSSSDALLIAAHDPAAGRILSHIVDLLRSEVGHKLHHQGMSALLSQPEFKDAHRAVPLALALEDEIRVARILSQISADKGTVVRIGHEMDCEQLGAVSVVARSYSVGDASGIIAVIGPTRMDYARALAAVSHMTNSIEESL